MMLILYCQLIEFIDMEGTEETHLRVRILGYFQNSLRQEEHGTWAALSSGLGPGTGFETEKEESRGKPVFSFLCFLVGTRAQVVPASTSPAFLLNQGKPFLSEVMFVSSLVYFLSNNGKINDCDRNKPSTGYRLGCISHEVHKALGEFEFLVTY